MSNIAIKSQNIAVNEENSLLHSINKNLAIEAENLSKIYNGSEIKTIALKNISLNVVRGRFLAIIGPSGSGKSTLLHLLAGLDQPSPKEGQKLNLCGESILRKSENWLAQFRAQHTGFILQFFGLLPTLTTLENVMIAAYFNGQKAKVGLKKSEEILRLVGLEQRLHHYPNQLSGGQKQRVAVARALVNKPEIIFADEPTGNLDSKSGQELLELFRKLVDEQHITLVLVTHDTRIYDYCDEIIEIVDGEIKQKTVFRPLEDKM